MATRKLSETVIQAASAAVDSFVGGSADLEPSTFTLIKGSTDVEKNAFAGKNLRFGVREHGMGAIMNGLAYYGGYIPYGSTFLCFSDYMRPTIRLAAVSHLQSIFIFTHDSIFLGEDGPTHQAVEHVNSLRMIPNVHVFRPADGLETAVCYEMALKNKKGPSVFCLSRQNLPTLDHVDGAGVSDLEKGAYTAFETQAGKKPELVFVASGSEVSLAIDVAKTLTSKAVKVVSMPCCELFAAQTDSWKTQLLPADAPIVVIEAGSGFGWDSILRGLGKKLHLVTMSSFGASAPASVLADKFGFTVPRVVEKLKSWTLA